MTPDQLGKIIAAAASSDIARYSWQGRGVAPPGYTKGMAVAFGQACEDLKAGAAYAVAMAVANTGNGLRDALAWYNARFSNLGMANDRDGIDTLRHLFVLMLGLGMRESSGQYCCGRDTSAHNVQADTAEAGLFQQSWDWHSASPELAKALVVKWLAAPVDSGLLAIFKEGVKVEPGDLDIYGSGDGATFQTLAKSRPLFAVQEAGVGLRCLRNHWGPINTRAAELMPQADSMFRMVQTIMDGTAVQTIPDITKPRHDPSWPPAPPWPPLVNNADREAIFGSYRYVSAPEAGNPEAIRILGTWEHDNITFVPIPQMAKRGLGKGMQFHKLGAKQLQQMWADWEAAGLLDRILEFDGSFVPRFVRGSRTNLSNHSFGCAFDVNYAQNTLGAIPALAGDKGSVRELVPIANKNGFFWGGHYSGRKDGMHFELTRVAGGAKIETRDLAWGQAALNKLGQVPPLAVDNDNGPRTKAALRAFQQRAGKTVDGLWGPETAEALGAALAAQAASPGAPGGVPTPAEESPLYGLPYFYLIGSESAQLPGDIGTITEVPFDMARPGLGVGVKYGNLFDEEYDDKTGVGAYGPYLKGDDVASEYGEGQIDPHKEAWGRNILDQLGRAKKQGFGFIEWDNPDAEGYRIDPDVLVALEASKAAGIQVVAKNAKLTTDATLYLRHPTVVACVVEKSAGSPQEYDRLRALAGKPKLPIIFVFFGDNRALAQQTAAQIIAQQFKGMSVTFSGTGEYATCEVILAPIS